MSGWVGAVVGQDALTAVCGALNAAYFGERLGEPGARWSRRVAAWAMALLSGAAVAEAAFSQALLWAHLDLLRFGPEAEALWVLARAPLLAATAFVSLLIARRELT